MDQLLQYLTKADWEALASEQYHTKVTIITKRLRLLGVQSMAEQSVKYATACLLTTYSQPPAADVIFAIVQDIKLSFSSSGINTIGLPAILKYPEDPNDLGPLVLAHAYTNGEVPAMLEHHQLPILCKLVPLRKTHKQVAPILQDQCQQQVASIKPLQQNVSSSSTGMGGTDCGNFMAMANGMMQFMNMVKTRPWMGSRGVSNKSILPCHLQSRGVSINSKATGAHCTSFSITN